MLEVGWWGSLRDLSKNILKHGVGKGKSCSQGGGGFEGADSPEKKMDRNTKLRATSGIVQKNDTKPLRIGSCTPLVPVLFLDGINGK